MSRTRQLNGNKKTALCAIQVQERLIKPFNDKVTEELGHQEI